MDIISYALSRKFTKDTVIGLGALKGANCVIKSIVHQNNTNVVTFEWTALDGSIRTSEMVVNDGTPIYIWISGNHYLYGDLAIYESKFYRCIIENSDVTFNNAHWNEIGSSDGNYDIVESAEDLPISFTASERKMYYVIDESAFYLWTGTEWVLQERSITDAEIDALFT